MVTTVQRWGNSQGLRLRKALLEDAGIAVGDRVDVTVRDGALVVTPVARVRGRLDLGQLLDRMPQDYKPAEVDWGDPVGKEAW